MKYFLVVFDIEIDSGVIVLGRMLVESDKDLYHWAVYDALTKAYRKNYDLICIGWDVKHYRITQIAP